MNDNYGGYSMLKKRMLVLFSHVREVGSKLTSSYKIENKRHIGSFHMYEKLDVEVLNISLIKEISMDYGAFCFC